MSNLIEAAPESPGGGTGGSNRVFILIALGLAGLLVIGLLLIFGYLAGSRLGLFGSRNGATPGSATALAANSAATATAAAIVSGGTFAPLPLGTRVPGATSAATAAAVGTGGAALAGTAVAGVGTAVATGTSVSAPTGGARTPAATVVAQAVTPAGGTPGAPTATATLVLTPGGNVGSGGGSGGAITPTPVPTPKPEGSSNLPGTGAELDAVLFAGLMVILLFIARGFRTALRD
jgi:hypothetical protein